MEGRTNPPWWRLDLWLDKLDGEGIALDEDRSPLAERGKRLAEKYTKEWPPEM